MALQERPGPGVTQAISLQRLGIADQIGGRSLRSDCAGMHRTNEIMVGIRLVDEAPTITAYCNDPRLRAIAHAMGKGRGRPDALGPLRYRHPIGAVTIGSGSGRARVGR